MSNTPNNPPDPQSNEYKIVPPWGFLGWLKEALLLLVDRPIFWLAYATLFAVLFSFSSHLLYLHIVGIVCLFTNVNICRYFYTGTYKPFPELAQKKHAFLVFNLLFAVILLRYLFWLSTHAASSIDMGGENVINLGIPMTDYINPLDLINSGLWRSMFDVFLHNFAIAPFHYIQLSVLTLFFSLSVFFYPLFIWKNNSAAFAYKLSLKISIANAVPLSIALIVLILLSFLVAVLPLAAFPYLYIFSSAVVYAAWADVFDERKRSNVKIPLPKIEVSPPVIAKMGSSQKSK